MTISNASDALRKLQGDGLTQGFPYNVTFKEPGDLRVIHRTATADAELTYPADFGVSGDPLAGMGQVDLVSIIPAADEFILVDRKTPARQDSALSQKAIFDSGEVEAQLDDLARQIGDNQRVLARAVLFDIEETAGVEIAPAAARLDTIFGFDDAGAPKLYDASDFKGDPGGINQIGTLAGRDAFDAEEAGFAYLATDTVPAVLYVRLSSVSGVWSAGVPFGDITQLMNADFSNATGQVPLSVLDVAITGGLKKPGDIVGPYFGSAPQAGHIFANYETFGAPGTIGATHADESYQDAYEAVKLLPWNNGDEVWGVDPVRSPDLREVTLVGGPMGTTTPARIQRATTITTTSGSPTATVADITGLAVGMYVFSANVPAGTTIASLVVSTKTLTLSANATAAGAATAARFSIINDPAVVGSVGGSAVYQLIADQIAAHLHSGETDGHDHPVKWTLTGGSGTQPGTISKTGGGGGNPGQETQDATDTFTTDAQTDVDEPHPNIQPSIICHWQVYVSPALAAPAVIPLGLGNQVYRYKAGTAAEAPGDGFVAFDTADPTSATTFRVDDHNRSGQDISGLLLSKFQSPAAIKGQLQVVNLTQPGKFGFFNGTAVGDQAGWVDYTIQTPPVAAVGLNDFEQGDSIAFVFDDAGPQGADGAAGGFEIDAEGLFAARSTHDNEVKGFIFYATDTDLAYQKLSAGAADWSDGIPAMQGPQGDPGVAGLSGTDPGYRYLFDSATDTLTDPGSGDFRINAGNNEIAFSKALAETGNPDVEAWLLSLDDSTSSGDKGRLTIKKIGEPETRAEFKVTGNVTNTTFVRVPVELVGSAPAFTNTDAFSIEFSPAGNQGADGAGAVDLAFRTIQVSGQGDVVADSATDTLTLAGSSTVEITTTPASDAISFQVPDDAITYAKIQNLTANKLLGSIAGGAAEEIDLTAAGRALLDDADAATQRATLGLADALKAAGENQGPITGGANVTAKDLGTKTTGTTTLDYGDRPNQRLVNGGAFTLAPDASEGSCILLITNNISAGAISTPGWTKVVGDAFDTTDGNDFKCFCSTDNGLSLLNVVAMQ